jgi:hypothetical protein
MFRPWIIYSGIKNLQFWLGYLRNKKYAIEETHNTEMLEHRLVVMGILTQPITKGSVFEQLRFETKFFEDQNGIQQTVPRIRTRVGVNHFLNQPKERPWFQTPNLSYYMELILRFDKDYAPNHFDTFRQSVYYSAGISRSLHFQAGLIAQLQLLSNGSQFNLYYGPLLTIKYNIQPKTRETFNHSEGGD